jgi:hypothetical protein
MTVILLAMMVGLVIGCSGDDTGKTDAQPPADAVAETPTETPAPDAPIQMTDGTVKHIEKAYEPVKEKWDLNGSPLTIGGLIYKPASQWTDHGVQGEKLAFYTYGPLRDDTYPSRLSVRFVPSASAAGYMDYFTAWLERLDLSHLKDPSAAAIRHDREADSMTVHVQSVMGGYLPEADEHVEGEILPRKSYRVVGIVVEAPEGLVLFELSGPDATAMTMIEAFMNGIYQLKRI